MAPIAGEALLELRSAIVDTIEAEVPTLRTVESHGGRFDEGELGRYSTRAPAALVVCAGIPQIRSEAGVVVASVRWSLFVLVRGDTDLRRDAEALYFVEQLAQLVARQRWGLDQVGKADQLTADNLFGGRIDRQGVALWALTWSQDLDLPDNPEPYTLDDLERVFAQYDLAPLDGVAEAEDHVEPRGAFMSSYGQIHVSASAPTAVAVAGTFVKAAGTTLLDDAEGFDDGATHVDNRLRFTGSAPTPILVTVACSISVNSPATVTLALAKNGVVDADTKIDRKLTSGDVEACNVAGIVTLDTNQHVELWLTADDAVSVTVNKLTAIAVSR